jgi:hypothetical protein
MRGLESKGMEEKIKGQLANLSFTTALLTTNYNIDIHEWHLIILASLLNMEAV